MDTYRFLNQVEFHLCDIQITRAGDDGDDPSGEGALSLSVACMRVEYQSRESPEQSAHREMR